MASCQRKRTAKAADHHHAAIPSNKLIQRASGALQNLKISRPCMVQSRHVCCPPREGSSLEACSLRPVPKTATCTITHTFSLASHCAMVTERSLLQSVSAPLGRRPEMITIVEPSGPGVLAISQSPARGRIPSEVLGLVVASECHEAHHCTINIRKPWDCRCHRT